METADSPLAHEYSNFGCVSWSGVRLGHRFTFLGEVATWDSPGFSETRFFACVPCVLSAGCATAGQIAPMNQSKTPATNDIDVMISLTKGICSDYLQFTAFSSTFVALPSKATSQSARIAVPMVYTGVVFITL